MKFYTCDRSVRDNTFKYYVTSKLSENIHETPEGYLVCVGVPIARTGEMVYGDGETPLETGDDGKVIIDRDEAEVFRKETIASFEGKAVTITHPTEFVGPKNWSQLSKGILQNVRRGEGDEKSDLVADLLIMDSVAINLVKNGLREVSCGYEAEYTQTGEGRGKQTNIIGNHLALVEQGRAGSSYAINDHKGKGDFKMKLSEKIKAIFAKAQDEAMKLATDEGGEEKKDDKKDESKDAGSYDELVKICKDLSAKIDGMKPAAKDVAGEAAAGSGEVDKPAAKDEESGAEVSLEDRLKALEASVAKLLEGKAEAGDEDEETESESEDEDFESEEEDGDEDSVKSKKTGDTASRAEILAPGIKMSKDVKAQALKAAYATKDGKSAIDKLTGGKAPTYDSAEKVETLFIAASELLKYSRTSEMSRSKVTDRRTEDSDESQPMTAEKMNEINAKHYNRK